MNSTNTNIVDLFKEKGVELSNQYFPIFLEQIDRGSTLKEHLQDIQFTQEVREILHEHLLLFLNDLGMEYMDFSMNEEYQKEALKSVRKRVLSELKRNYSERIEEMIAEDREECQWAEEDEEYHAERKYIADKDFIGEVSEQERTDEIQKAQNKQKEMQKEIERKQNIQQMLQ